MLRIGVDIGGTFTDFVAFDVEAGGIATAKLLTTPAAPAVAVIEGLERLIRRVGASLGEVEVLVHGTTLATNAIVERRGAKTALLTTRGFRDVLAIGRERRYDVYDILYRVPAPLVPRQLCWEVAERVSNEGIVLTPLDPGKLIEGIASSINEEAIEAIAICFLHSYANPINERAARRAIEEVWPKIFVSVSSDLVGEVGEYERASSVVANAYVQPKVKTYLEALAADLEARGLGGRIYVMLSHGGLTTPEVAARCPIGIIESGPAGGVQAAAAIAQALDVRRVVAFDMGGTTAKICLITDGKPSTSNHFEVARVDWSKPGSGLPVKAPFIEMIEIGTGGGSIARVDSLGLLAVGPLSAGARPGPACYGFGGELPTVTDADLVLGYLDPEYFAGGEIRLNVEAARAAIEEHVAKPRGLTLVEAAWGISEVANENMANAARLHAVQRGCDITGFTLVAFGGAGPVHAGELARKLGVKEIILPPWGGVLSALGFLLSPVSFELSRSLPQPLGRVDPGQVNAVLEEMEVRTRAVVVQAGIEDSDIRFDRSCSMSYVGQGFEVNVAFPWRRLTDEKRVELKSAFEARYRELYARLIPGLEIQAITWRVTAKGPKPPIPRFGDSLTRRSMERAGRVPRMAFDPALGAFREHAVYDRELLSENASFTGPAIVEAMESTIVISGDMTVRRDSVGNLIMSSGR